MSSKSSNSGNAGSGWTLTGVSGQKQKLGSIRREATGPSNADPRAKTRRPKQ